jgi:hypothetical protein
MSLQTIAQELEVVEETPSEYAVLQPVSTQIQPSMLTVHTTSEPTISEEYVESVKPVECLELVECVEPTDEIVVEDLGEIPGLNGKLDPVKEKALEVSESDSNEEDKLDVNDNIKSKKDDRWDWESKGPVGFVAWVYDRFASVPKHSGYDSAGIERAIAFLEKLDNEISKAMRLDLDGELDFNQIEDIRSKIEDGIERLYNRLDKIKSKSKKKRKKADESYELIKEAQKIPGVAGIYVTVPLLISRIARVCINGMVSAGHDIEDLFNRQVKKYKLNDREKAETMQLLSDMGYPLRQDRGFLLDEDVDTRSSDNFDWNANYKG